MVIIETPTFTRWVTELLPDDDYRALQAALIARPDAGAILRGSGGIRKLRWERPDVASAAACASFITGPYRRSKS